MYKIIKIKITGLSPSSSVLLLVAIILTVAIATTTTMVYGQLPRLTTATNTTTSLNATNATAVVATNTTAATAPTPTIITQLLGVRGEVIPLHAENIQFQQEDPLFAKLVQVINDCMNFVVAQDQEGDIDQLDNNRKFSCDSVISQGVEQFCGFSPTSDVLECAEANQMHLIYMVTAGASGFST
ncbi:MAG TPA: hypothetical protein VN239_04790 [Nitrososphaera sp.]|jgi:hypothetical protein|nr:hypothetical protein [Nitrososphaera sp.]